MPSRVQPGRKCPICGAPTEERWRPFCSRRCADIDLSRWLSGAYAIPGDVGADEEEVPATLPTEEDKNGD